MTHALETIADQEAQNIWRAAAPIDPVARHHADVFIDELRFIIYEAARGDTDVVDFLLKRQRRPSVVADAAVKRHALTENPGDVELSPLYLSLDAHGKAAVDLHAWNNMSARPGTLNQHRNSICRNPQVKLDNLLQQLHRHVKSFWDQQQDRPVQPADTVPAKPRAAATPTGTNVVYPAQWQRSAGTQTRG